MPPEEVAHADGGFQPGHSRLRAKVLERLPHRVYYQVAREVGIGGGALRVGVFLFGEQSLQLVLELLKLRRASREELRHRTPPDVSREDILFLECGGAVLALNLAEGFDGFNVGAGAGFRTTGNYSVVGDAIVAVEVGADDILGAGWEGSLGLGGVPHNSADSSSAWLQLRPFSLACSDARLADSAALCAAWCN